MTQPTDLAVSETRAMARVEQPSGGSELAQLIQAAKDGMPADTLERLVGLMERVTARRAAMEFAEAMARFQLACPPIKRTSKANIVTKNGAKYGYSYAELDEIARTVGPHLHAQGLSYTWDSSIVDRYMTITCTLRHANGHSVSASFTGSIESDAGMSAVQKSAATLTFGRRQSLVQVLGLTTCDEDADGGESHVRPAGPGLTEDQVHSIEDLIVDVNANRDLFLKHVKVKALSEIPQSDFEHWMGQLERKRKP